jgi:hypothetical protein
MVVGVWLISFVFSVLLNWLARRQIRRKALGSDILGNNATGVQDYPQWVSGPMFRPLPKVLSEEIEAISEKAAAASIKVLRPAIKRLALSEDEDAKTVFSEVMDRIFPHRARGSGRSWKCTAIGTLPLPPSLSHGVRSPLVVHRPRPFHPASGSSMRPSKPLM